MAIRRHLLAGTVVRARRIVPGAVLLALACGPAQGRMEVAWTGGDTGAASLPARAEHCPGAPVELLAASGDTGVIIALFGAQPLAAGAYQVADSARAPALAPAATVGARWVDSVIIAGYRGAEGTVTLSAAGNELSGSFSVRARLLDQSREVTLSGTFRRVPLEACRPASTTDSARSRS